MCVVDKFLFVALNLYSRPIVNLSPDVDIIICLFLFLAINEITNCRILIATNFPSPEESLSDASGDKLSNKFC